MTNKQLKAKIGKVIPIVLPIAIIGEGKVCIDGKYKLTIKPDTIIRCSPTKIEFRTGTVGLTYCRLEMKYRWTTYGYR